MRDNWNHPSVAIWDAAQRNHVGVSERQADSGSPRLGPLQSALGERLQPAARARTIPTSGILTCRGGRAETAFVDMTELEGMMDGKAKDGKLPGEVCFAPRGHHQRVRLAVASSRRDPDEAFA